MKRWHAVLTGLCVAVAAVQAWQSRYAMNSDGVAYLDLAGNWAAGEWREAVSPFWPPLYSWVLGIGLAAGRPSPAWELPLARLVNFAAFLAALAGFRFFLGRFTETWIVIFGYTVFALTSLGMITTRLLTPDLCAAAAVYWAAGLLLRMQAGERGWKIGAWLGVALGLGYLARSSLQPLGVVFVAVAAWVGGRRPAGAALGIFLAVIALWVGVASWVHGRLVLNENAKVNYAWHVNGVSRRYWEGGLHPPRKLLDRPLLLEFEVPWKATHPLGYDPSYWYGGVQPKLDWRQQGQALQRSWRVYRRVFLEGWQITLLVVAGMAVALGGGRVTLRSGLPLLVPAAAAFVMYGLVHVEPRYLAPFVTLLWMGLVGGARMGEAQAEAVKVAAVVVAVVGLGALLRGSMTQAPERYSRAVAELQGAGVRAGDRLGLIGLPSPDVVWARLARARVVAHIPGESAGDYWEGPVERRAQVRRAFEKVGVRALLTAKLDPPPAEEPWRRVEGTPFWYWMLR